MDYLITSAGGRASRAVVGGHTIHFNVPNQDGDGSAPGPLGVFATAAGACAYYFASGPLVNAGLPTEGLEVAVHTDMVRDPGPRIAHMHIKVRLPPDIPAEIKEKVTTAVCRCPVKGTLSLLPELEVTVEG